jgi:hypothetical protein
MRVACGQPWPIKTNPLSRFRERDCDIAMRYATPSAVASCEIPQSRLKAVTVSGRKDSWNETPFRPLAEALDPYRAGNRCALDSLDTDRSTTLSPETVTANVYLHQGIEISQASVQCHEKFSAR